MARGAPEKCDQERYQLATSASHMLHRAEQLASESFSQLADDALTLRQFSVLAAIAGNPGLNQNALVRVTGIDRSTLADMMSRMEDRGLVTRTPSPVDARALSIHLSPSGKALLRQMDEHARAADAAILTLLPKTKRRTFLSTLVKLLKRADERAARADRDARRLAKRQAKLIARAAKEKSKGQRKHSA